MKVLFLSPGDSLDYQNDSLLIGLKELLGADVVDVNKHHHLYDTFPEDGLANMYGKGMTISRVLPDLFVDRNDIEGRIAAREFDLVVYGAVWRSHEYLPLVLETYPPEAIAFVDGEDAASLHPLVAFHTRYFKRELFAQHPATLPTVHPIMFGIPESKLDFSRPKTRDIAFCDPRDTSTYIYEDEASYYAGYGEARFGVTIRKAGWDCMRHYEILANGAIPAFLDIGTCPPTTLHMFPKLRCLQVLHEGANEDTYERHAEWFQQYTRTHLTTSALAKRFLDTMAGAAVPPLEVAA
ncbi:MAG: hypothetical protein KDC33_06080 [Thermoleophilia bacterium]|nr:hypothetical protein [Thermoleophilia bacterium]